MKSVNALQRDVQDALDLQPAIRTGTIGVSVEEDGVVTLSGHVASHFDKEAAELAAKQVPGVHAVANELQVRLSESAQRDDTDLAIGIRRALDWNEAVPSERITVLVERGRVILEGEVDWRYQREAAEHAAAGLAGLHAVDNRIRIAVPPESGMISLRCDGNGHFATAWPHARR